MILVMERPGVYRITTAYDLGWADARRHRIAGTSYLTGERVALARRRIGWAAAAGYVRGYADYLECVR